MYVCVFIFIYVYVIIIYIYVYVIVWICKYLSFCRFIYLSICLSQYATRTNSVYHICGNYFHAIRRLVSILNMFGFHFHTGSCAICAGVVPICHRVQPISTSPE